MPCTIDQCDGLWQRTGNYEKDSHSGQSDNRTCPEGLNEITETSARLQAEIWTHELKKTENSHKGSTVTFCESVWLSAGSTDRVLVQTHAAHTLTPYFSKTHFNIVPFFVRLDVSIGLKVLPEFIILYPPFKSRSLHTPPLLHLNIPCTAVNKLWIPLLCHVIHSPVTFSQFYIHLSTFEFTIRSICETNVPTAALAWAEIFSVYYSGRGPVPVAAQSKTWVYGRSLAGIRSSNRAGSMDVCLVSVVYG